VSANKTKAKSRETTRVGRTVRDWRERARLTREELAMKTGRCLSTIRNWEKDREPRVSDLVMLEEIHPGLVRALFPDAFRKRRARFAANGVARPSASA
jgi:transcriptional regulator with XRE-family HTH domain